MFPRSFHFLVHFAWASYLIPLLYGPRTATRVSTRVFRSQLPFASRRIPYTCKLVLLATTSSLSLLLRRGAGTWHQRCVHDPREKLIADNRTHPISFPKTIIRYYEAFSTVIDSLSIQFSQFLEMRGSYQGSPGVWLS